MQNKIARIHVNQHVIKANAKNGENNPIFTVKQGGKNTYAFNVKVKGEMELVYSPDKPLSCGAKVWIETRGDIELDKSSDTKLDKSSDTKGYFNPHVNVKLPSLSSAKMDRKFKEFLRNKSKIIQNKNKLSA
tara:strand:- start:11 stop:406 length:396 start_codon:yes stop_codon:yes gene_type:complete